MSRNPPNKNDWEEAISLVKIFIEAEGLNDSQLASKAKLHRSTISRFLGKHTFPDLLSVLAIYAVIKDTLDRDQKVSFQRVSGIASLLLELEKNDIYLVDLLPESESMNPSRASLQLMTIAESPMCHNE